MAVIHNNGELIGGQAVLEGVMMRARDVCSIAVRRASGRVVVDRRPWKTLTRKFKFLKMPLVRGPVFLIEAMVNGLSALSFSANQALEEEEEKALSPWAMALTMGLAVAFAIGLFVVLPHLLTVLVGKVSKSGLTVDSAMFHLVDGVIKVAFFIGYIWLIARLKDIRRVFMYHGAEHKCVHAHEAGKEMTVENVRPFSRLHPRCGTAFILFVLLISLFLFSAIFPLLPGAGKGGAVWTHAAYIGLKIFLMIPIAGVSYEIIRASAKRMENPLVRLAVAPGLIMQRMTTGEPTDDMIEVAIVALKSAIADQKDQTPDPI